MTTVCVIREIADKYHIIQLYDNFMCEDKQGIAMETYLDIIKRSIR